MNYLLGEVFSLCWQCGRINAFLKHAYKCYFYSSLITVDCVVTLCNVVQNPSNCLHILLPSIKTSLTLQACFLLVHYLSFLFVCCVLYIFMQHFRVA